MVPSEVIDLYGRIFERHRNKINRGLSGVPIYYTPENITEFMKYGALENGMRFVVFLGELCDPHPRKKYTEWIVTRVCDYLYHRGEVEPEMIKDLMAAFMRYKHLFPIEIRDLYRCKTLDDFFIVMNTAMREFSDQIVKFDHDELRDLIKNGEMVVIQDGPPKIIHIKSNSAAMLMSRGTKWCFNSSAEMAFDRYKEQGAIYFCRSKVDSFAVLYSYSGGFTEFRNELNEIADYMPAVYLEIIWKYHSKNVVSPTTMEINTVDAIY
jgi:hypothetical protein